LRQRHRRLQQAQPLLPLLRAPPQGCAKLLAISSGVSYTLLEGAPAWREPGTFATLLELLRAPGVSGITLRTQEHVTSVQVRARVLDGKGGRGGRCTGRQWS
jgi:hypothetical protein